MKRDDFWHLDPPLLSGVLALCGLSLVVLYSAGGEDMSLVVRQGMRMLVAVVAMIALAQVAPETLSRWAPWVFGLVARYPLIAIEPNAARCLP